MPAYRMPMGGAEDALVWMKGTKLAAPCKALFEWRHGHHCCKPSGFLCDAPVGDEGKTCDMPICEDHAKQVGKDRHLCPKHAAEHVQQQPELF